MSARLFIGIRVDNAPHEFHNGCSRWLLMLAIGIAAYYEWFVVKLFMTDNLHCPFYVCLILLPQDVL